jgi:hypothetical protein
LQALSETENSDCLRTFLSLTLLANCSENNLLTCGLLILLAQSGQVKMMNEMRILMATWNEVSTFLQGLGMKEDGSLWSGFYKWDDGRSQTIIAAKVDLEGDALDALMVASPFAEVGNITAEQALDSAVAYGVRKLGDFYCLTDTVPIADLDDNEVLITFEMLARLADHIEQKHSTHDKH